MNHCMMMYVAAGGMVLLLLYLVNRGDEGDYIFLAFSVPFFLLVIVFYWFAYIRLKYVIGEDTVSAKGFLTMTEVPYSLIKEMKEIVDPYASFFQLSISKDRIRIVYERVSEKGRLRRYGLTISPRDKEEFITKLEAKLPGIRVTRL